MPYEAAKCPNCGGSIELNSNQETGYCMYCGSKIIVRDAIQKTKIEFSMPGVSSVENDIRRGQQFLSAGDFKNAFFLFCSAVDKQSDNFDAWSGCLAAATQNYTWVDYIWIRLEGGRGFESILRNCMRYAGNREQEQQIRRNIKKTLDSMEQTEAGNIKYHKRYQLRFMLYLVIAAASSIVGVTSYLNMRNAHGQINFELYGIFSIINLVLALIFWLMVFIKAPGLKAGRDRDKNVTLYIQWIKELAQKL